MTVQFGTYQFKTKEGREGRQIWDELRKKYVALSPEEWVRQHWIQYLLKDLKISPMLSRSEMSITINGRKKRCDIVVFDRSGSAQVIIECKAPEVKLSQETVDQASRYNLNLGVPYIVISNGIQHIGLALDKLKQCYAALEQFPLPSEKQLET